MSVTIDIRGTSAGGGSASGGSTGGGATTGGTGGNGFLPADDRMISDIRREMQSRGVLLVPGSQGLSQILGEYKRQLGDQARSEITQRFQAQRDDISRRRTAAYRGIERDIEAAYRTGLAGDDDPNDPATQAFWRSQAERKFKGAWERIGKQYDEEEKRLAGEEEAAKSKVETELTDAIKRLTDTFDRESKANPDVPDSYINRLRGQQKALIAERDAAPDQEGAIAASKRLAEVNEQLRRAMTGEDTTQNRGGGGWGVALSGMRGMEQFMGAAGSGNLGGMINGLGGTGVGIASALGSLSLSGAATWMGVIGAIAALASGVQQGGERYNQMAGLAAFRATTGYEGFESGRRIGPMVRGGFRGSEAYDISRLGLGETEFAREAENRIRARGTSEDWFNEVYRQIGLERNFALRSGALSAAGAYDRYGISGTEAVTRLMNTLAGIRGSGVSRGDFTRAQEKLDVQQQIMASYMGRADRPDYDVANRTVAALSAVRGITQDARIGSDYAAMQNALQNPMNERMKALIYGTIEDIMPGTRGRMDKIDFALRDPKNEGQILQSVIQRITAMYGGMDTQMGYFAFRNMFPGIAPDRLKSYIADFSNPESQASQLLMKSLRGGAALTDANGSVADRLARQGTEYTSDVTSFLQDIKNNVQGIFDYISTGGSGNNSIRSAGGNG